METRNKVKLIEIRTSQGELVCSFQIREKEEDKYRTLPKGDSGKGEENEPKGKDKGNTPDNKNDLMSHAQKRYLFRLLAERGVEGNDAYEYLKKRFGADSLKEVTKIDASQVIEKLLDELKGGESHGSPK